MKQSIKIWILVALMILSGIFDIWTTFMGRLDFETNPIYILTGNIGFVILLKFLTIGALGFFLYRFATKKPSETLRFAVVIVAIYLILIQTLAGIANFDTAQTIKENPTLEAANNSVKVKTYMKLGLVFYYLPVSLGILAFKVYSWIYLAQALKKKKKELG